MGKKNSNKMTNKKRAKKIGDAITRFDLFGSQVTLTHAGEAKYKTKFGAFFTVIYIIGIMVIGFDGLAKIYTGQIQSMSTEIR